MVTLSLTFNFEKIERILQLGFLAKALYRGVVSIEFSPLFLMGVLMLQIIKTKSNLMINIVDFRAVDNKKMTVILLSVFDDILIVGCRGVVQLGGLVPGFPWEIPLRKRLIYLTPEPLHENVLTRLEGWILTRSICYGNLVN